MVVFGTEYFYGGGIEYTSPVELSSSHWGFGVYITLSAPSTQGTLPMLGTPDKIVELGTTCIPNDVFMDYLADISPQYS